MIARLPFNICRVYFVYILFFPSGLNILFFILQNDLNGEKDKFTSLEKGIDAVNTDTKSQVIVTRYKLLEASVKETCIFKKLD